MIRRLAPRDAEAFRELRLEGLRREPLAFGAAWEEEAQRPLSWFAGMLESQAVFAAPDATDALAGMVGFGRDAASKRRHIGQVWGMYVRAAARSSGLGGALVAAALEHARGSVTQIQLAVGRENHAAIRLYARAGFVIYGTERAALVVEGVVVDEHLMALQLPSAG